MTGDVQFSSQNGQKGKLILLYVLETTLAMFLVGITDIVLKTRVNTYIAV